VVEPDYRKSLEELRGEWEGCKSCSLWEHREQVNGQVVFGDGKTGGVLLIGEGPGIEEEKQGIPFIGRSGSFLREVLERMGLENYYLTNTVLCRSCAMKLDKSGQPMMKRVWGSDLMVPRYEDQPPLKQQKEACEPRLHQEIYLVDPVVIVALGKPASETIFRRSVTLAKSHGVAEEITIPGAARVPALTPKGKWARKVKGKMVRPSEQYMVRYLAVPTYHPAHVLRNMRDEKERLFDKFVDDLRMAKKIYNRYQLEVYGVLPGEEQALSYDDLLEIAEEE
jgi:uracil-DNA glycosylase